jgi:pyruvate dehydrogenase E1 component alpha subunit
MIEQTLLELARAGRLKSTPDLQIGNEAISIGSMIELHPADGVSSPLTVASAVICGIPLGLLFAEILQLRAEYLASAPETTQPSIHLIPTAIGLASQLNIAAGFAFAAKVAEQRAVVVVQLPDGFKALGFWHEAATLASAERLPIIFVARRVFQDAGGSGGSELRDRAYSYGMPGITVDGNDVVAMWRVTQESIHRARGGAGPTLIDAQVLPVNLKTNGSLDANDPLHRMQHYLQKRNHWDASWKRGLEQKFTAEIKAARAFFRDSSG